MLNEKFKFHHFGLATKNEKISRFNLQALGFTFGDSVYDPIQKVNLQLGKNSCSTFPQVELVWESAGVASPISSFLKSADSIFYHFCLTCSDIHSISKDLTELNLRFIQVTDVSPAILFENRNIVFYKVKNLGLVEFLEII